MIRHIEAGLQGDRFNDDSRLSPIAVDVKDGRIVRIRPLHLDESYAKEELNYYYLEKDGRVFEPGFKTLIPPFSIAYKNRAYSRNRVPAPLIRVDWDPNGERNPQNRGISKYRKISWDEALKIISDEIKRIHDEYGNHSIYCQAEGHGEGKVAAGYVEDVAIDPVGEARSDAEIVADVAGALERFGGKYESLRDKFMRGMTHEETIRKGFDESGLPEDFTWEDLMEKVDVAALAEQYPEQVRNKNLLRGMKISIRR